MILSETDTAGASGLEDRSTDTGSDQGANSSDVLLGCIQDKIDGFDYNSEGERIPNNCPMDEGKLDVEYIYEGDILRISDGDHTHEFTVDKNQLVYVDGAVAFDMRSARIKDEYYSEVREGTLAHMMSKARH